MLIIRAHAPSNSSIRSLRRTFSREESALHSNNVNSRRAQLAALHRWKDVNDPALHGARIALREETFVAALERALRAAPPVTPKLRARVAALLTAAGLAPRR